MYKIVTDGSCDFDEELSKKFNVEVVPFYVSKRGDENHGKEGIDITVREFYQFMIDNPKVFPKTSMPSIQDYIDVFEPILKRGEDIICICITTKFSGSYNSASNAKDMLLEDYPDRKIVVIDSKINTVLQGLLVEETSEMKKDNYDFDEVVNTIETIKPTGRIIFTIGSMSYLVAGGRVGKLSGIGAGVLGIKPNIVLKEGEIFNEGISRGRKKSLQKVIDTTIKHFKDNNINPNDYKFCIGFGYDKEEGQRFLDAMTDALKTNFKDFSQNIYLRQIGATISVHTGPHPLGIAFIKKYK